MDGGDRRSKKCIYLDYNGTTPIHPSVLDAMMPYLTEHFGNPSSSHHFGREPKLAVDRARRSLLRIIRPKEGDDDDAGSHESGSGDPSSSIVFTGCGTEANNLAIRLSLLSSWHKADDGDGDGDGDDGPPLHVVSTSVEHPAVSQCLDSYAAPDGPTPRISVTYVPVDGEGVVSADDVIDAIRPNTALVTVMTANNEVGSVQPVFEIAKRCRERRILFHTDAAQAVGKIDLRGLAHPAIGADMVTIVGHKFGAPKGIAALYVRPGCLDEDGRTEPEDGGGSVLLVGGGQEGGGRGGTENVPYIAGMGRAAEMLVERRMLPQGDTVDGWEYNSMRMRAMRNRMSARIVKQLGGGTPTSIVRINHPQDPERRLPNTLSLGLRGVSSGALLASIGDVIACSAGSACHSSSGANASYSAVLKAMNVPPEYAMGTLRLSVGPDTTGEEVDFAADIIVEEVKKLLGL